MGSSLMKSSNNSHQLETQYSRPLLDERSLVLRLKEIEGETNVAKWEVAETLHKLRHHYGMSYDEMAVLFNDHGISWISRSAVSKLTRVYDYVFGYPYNEQLLTLERAKTSPYTMYRILNQLGEIPASVVEAANQGDKSETELVTLADPATIQYKVVSIQQEIHELTHDARAKLAEAAGYEELTFTSFLEFWAKLTMESSVEVLRNLWRKEHGE